MILIDTGPIVAFFDKDDRFHSVCTDILKEQGGGHRLHRGHMAAHPRSPDTEPADIGADVKDPVIRQDIIEPVLGY